MSKMVINLILNRTSDWKRPLTSGV